MAASAGISTKYSPDRPVSKQVKGRLERRGQIFSQEESCMEPDLICAKRRPSRPQSFKRSFQKWSTSKIGKTALQNRWCTVSPLAKADQVWEIIVGCKILKHCVWRHILGCKVWSKAMQSVGGRAGRHVLAHYGETFSTFNLVMQRQATSQNYIKPPIWPFASSCPTFPNFFSADKLSLGGQVHHWRKGELW